MARRREFSIDPQRVARYREAAAAAKASARSASADDRVARDRVRGLEQDVRRIELLAGRFAEPRELEVTRRHLAQARVERAQLREQHEHALERSGHAGRIWANIEQHMREQRERAS